MPATLWNETATTVEVEAPLRASLPPTRRSCEAVAMFGLSLDRIEQPATASRKKVALPEGGVALLTGPSGAGKSTLLHAIGRTLERRGEPVLRFDRVRLRERPAVDLVGRDADDAMRRLAGAGLGEAQCFVRRPSELSEGQRWRLRLAVALQRLESLAAQSPTGRATLCVDEFLASLDGVTAAGVAMSLRRAASSGGALRVVAACCDETISRWLAPDAHVRVAQDGSFHEARAEAQPPLRFRVEVGDGRDYARLASHHYRAKAPAAPVRVLRAVVDDMPSGEEGGSLVAGVLVIAMPTLNGAWRDIAWPGRYTASCKRENARRVNTELRRLARTIVDPRLRGCGVATALVRAYLSDPITPRSEAVAGMGRAARFHERAGMTAYRLPPCEPDARLLDALDHCGVDRWRLAQPRCALTRAIDAQGMAFIEREARRWAKASRRTARLADLPLPELFSQACRRIATPMHAYAHSI